MESAQQIVVTATLSPAQSAAALKVFPVVVRRTWAALGLCVLGLAVVLVGSTVLSDGPRSPVGAAAPVVLMVGVVAVTLGWTRSAARRVAAVPQTWTFTPAGVSRTSARGDDTIGWERVADLRRAGDLVAMLWQPPGCVAALPADALDGAASAQVFAWWAQARVRAPDAAATGDRAPHGG